jgi:hypothetical protein
VREGEPDIPFSHLRGPPVLECFAELEKALLRHGGEQVIEAGKVAIGCGMRDAGLARDLPQRDCGKPLFIQEIGRRADERTRQVSVMISAP